jgi:hypothetical protein
MARPVHRLASVPLVVGLSFALDCTCAEPPATPAPSDDNDNIVAEGEGEDGGDGEGEGEETGPDGDPCVVVVLGDNLPPATALRLVDLVTGAMPDGSAFRRLDADDPLPAPGCAASRVLAFGHSVVSAALIDEAALVALGPEGYVLKTGRIRVGDVDHDVLAADGVPAGVDHHVPSPGGAAFGSYALLEQLGFAFLHPLSPTLPVALPDRLPDLDLASSPRWPRRNIHLHTMHPLELTELLNGWGDGDPDDVDGWNAMRPEWSIYLEWLVANGQNEVEWILLEAESWADFAQSAERQRRLTLLVDDCHAWGIACGIDVPIALQQQHTWRLVRREGTQEEEFAQIHERLDYLMACGFDFLSTENGSTEFTNPGAERMLAWIDETARYLDEQYDREALIKVHVSVGQTAEPFVDRDTGAPLNFNFLPTYADPRMGVMPHTVQMYGLEDPAPTYQNTDFGSIREFLHEEVGRRPVVWHPETAYWVSVDVDVPLFLPLYAERRVADLQLLADDEDLGLMGRGEHAGGRMDGQSIFSSGWEWGYWLNDVVAARAAWDPFQGESTSTATMGRILSPLARVLGRGGSAVVAEVVALARKQHDELILGKVDGIAPTDIVRRNGFAYLAGTEAFDDVANLGTNVGINVNVTQPDKLGLVEMRNPLHAPPAYTGEIDRLLSQVLATHQDSEDRLTSLLVDGVGHELYDEIVAATRITRLRAAQLLGLYTYVDNLLDLDDDERGPALVAARAALDEAATIVADREAHYRVPAERIAGWRENPTAYRFAFLWTAHSLYFWWRDEGKAVDAPASPCYLNIIDPADVALGEGGINDMTRVARALLDGGFLDGIGECLAAPVEEPTLPPPGLRRRP